MSTDTVQEDIPPITFAWRLRIAREWAGMDQGMLCDASGVSRQTISNYETGHTKPNRIYLRALAVALGVSGYWLETGQAPTNGGPDGVAGPGFEPGTSGLQVGADTPEHFVPIAPAA